MDEDTKEIFLNQVKDIFYSGKQDVYRVKTAMGYEIKATLKHRFLTLGGWKRLEDIVSGDKVYVNGIPAYKSKDWLKKHHHRNLKVAIPDRILSIEYVGQEDTYDLAMATEPHNFVANGFIVHNSQESQRYVNYDRKGIICFVRPQFFNDEKVDPKTIEEFKDTCQNLAEKYEELIQGGLPPEEARGLLPNCTATVIGVTANLREWRHIFRMRLDGAAQPQIRALLLALRQRMELKYDLAWAFKDIPVDTNRLHSVPEL